MIKTANDWSEGLKSLNGARCHQIIEYAPDLIPIFREFPDKVYNYIFDVILNEDVKWFKLYSEYNSKKKVYVWVSKNSRLIASSQEIKHIPKEKWVKIDALSNLQLLNYRQNSTSLFTGYILARPIDSIQKFKYNLDFVKPINN